MNLLDLWLTLKRTFSAPDQGPLMAHSGHYYVAFDVAFGGKADMGYRTAHVRL